jgi:hypothetical protein
MPVTLANNEKFPVQLRTGDRFNVKITPEDSNKDPWVMSIEIGRNVELASEQAVVDFVNQLRDEDNVSPHRTTVGKRFV